MLWYEIISEEERKTYIKRIEFHLETAVSELDELERKLVECRYIHYWSMGKCAMEIGYSEKTLFLMKKSLLDKLLVSLAAITNI